MPQKKLAYIGRSNVGKSSLINYIRAQNSAPVSKTPGRTRKHHEYEYNKQVVLVDLPGYGYAKISKERRNIWDDLLITLLYDDPDFCHLFVLIDSSIPPQKIDIDFIQWLDSHTIPYTIVFTKRDKASQKEKKAILDEWKQLFTTLSITPHVILTSVVQKLGRQELREYISHIISS